jgi:CelD/BcsL family acetyltransferase involved in cellulose biosynthesis
MAANLQISCVSDPAGFIALREPWERLSSGNVAMSVFQSYDWQSIWWKYYADGSPYVLLAHVDSELVAILPLYRSIERLPLGRPLMRIRLIGVGGDTSPDYLGPIASPEFAGEAAGAFLAYLMRHQSDWDVLELTDLADGSAMLAAVRALNGSTQHRVTVAEAARIFYTRLPESWDSYLAQRTKHARQGICAATRKLMARPDSRIFVWSDRSGLDTAIDRLIQLHRQRWQGRAEHYSFSTDSYNAFHRELMHRFMDRGWLRLYCVELAGELVGIYYFYSFRNTLYHFQGGLDPQHEKLRIGTCLLAFAVESGIAEGCNCLDMLRGEYDYKKRWAPDVRCTYSARILRFTLPTLIDRTMRRLVMPVHARLARLVTAHA